MGNHSEAVAYWYFRLQGCFTFTNFLLHKFDGTGGVYSDGDVIAVRFPYREESDMKADEEGEVRGAEGDNLFKPGKINLCLVDVKQGQPCLNLSWLIPEKKAIEAMIERTGLFYDSSLVTNAIQQNWYYEDNLYFVRVMVVAKHTSQNAPYLITLDEYNKPGNEILRNNGYGRNNNDELLDKQGQPVNAMPLPQEQQLIWDEVIGFLHKRLNHQSISEKDVNDKANNDQWDSIGKELYNLAKQHKDAKPAFIKAVKDRFLKESKDATQS